MNGIVGETSTSVSVQSTSDKNSNKWLYLPFVLLQSMGIKG